MTEQERIKALEAQINELIYSRNKLLKEKSDNQLLTNPSIADALSDLMEAKRNGEVGKFKETTEQLWEMTRADYSGDIQKDPIKDMEKFYSVTPYFELPERIGVKAKFKRGNTVIIGARPGVGKTKLLANLVYEDLKEKIPIAVYSLEQNRVDIWIAIAQLWIYENHKKSVSFWKMSEIMKDPKYASIKQAFNKWVSDRLVCVRIIDASGYSASDIKRSLESVTQQLKAKPEKVYVDYLQIISREQGFRGSQKESMDMVSKILTTKCKRMDNVFILLSQLNRESEEKKKPSLADFKESGAIEQDAGIAIIITRPEDSSGDFTDEVNFWIVKDRYGGVRGKKTAFIDKPTFYIGKEESF
jgi:replicative DNA helicase